MTAVPTCVSPVTSRRLPGPKPRMGAYLVDSWPKVNDPTVCTPFVMMRPPLLLETVSAVPNGSLPCLPRYTRVKVISVGPQYVFAALSRRGGIAPAPCVT